MFLELSVWLSNHDIRRGLRIAERIITSPLVSVESLISTWVNGDRLRIPEMKVRQALLYGSYNMFKQDHSEYILNLFSVTQKHITSPILKPSILRLLIDVKGSSNSGEEEYLSLLQISEYFDACGIGQSTLRIHIKELLQFRLLEPYDPTDENVDDAQRVRVTHSGQIHYELITQGYIYLQNMALVTAIRNFSVIEQIRKISNISNKKRSDWDKLKSIFVNYLIEEDQCFLNVPSTEQYKSQVQMRKDFRAKWIIK